jgi:hypothetical protein
MKFSPGDRVVAYIFEEWIPAEVIRYDSAFQEEKSVWCLWDDDNEEATIDEGSLQLDLTYNSPLRKALE